MNWLHNILGLNKQKVNEEKQLEQQSQPHAISQDPDYPKSFGYKMCWLAVKADNPEEVIKKLGGKNVCEANWESALNCVSGANKTEQIFVTPSFDGYVLALNVEDLYEYEEYLNKVAVQFEELQYFASHRVVDLYGWARYYKGELNRRYYFCGADGENPWNDGDLTEEERELGLSDLPCGDSEEWDDCTFPDEETVIEVARLWGVDPLLEKYQQNKSIGYLCDLELD